MIARLLTILCTVSFTVFAHQGDQPAQCGEMIAQLWFAETALAEHTGQPGRLFPHAARDITVQDVRNLMKDTVRSLTDAGIEFDVVSPAEQRPKRWTTALASRNKVVPETGSLFRIRSLRNVPVPSPVVAAAPFWQHPKAVETLAEFEAAGLPFFIDPTVLLLGWDGVHYSERPEQAEMIAVSPTASFASVRHERQHWIYHGQGLHQLLVQISRAVLGADGQVLLDFPADGSISLDAGTIYAALELWSHGMSSRSINEYFAIEEEIQQLERDGAEPNGYLIRMANAYHRNIVIDELSRTAMVRHLVRSERSLFLMALAEHYDHNEYLLDRSAPSADKRALWQTSLLDLHLGERYAHAVLAADGPSEYTDRVLAKIAEVRKRRDRQ